MPLLSVPDLDIVKPCILVLFNVDVDGEMGVDISHLVFVSLGDTDYEIVDERFDCPESSDILARAVVDFDRDLLL